MKAATIKIGIIILSLFFLNCKQETPSIYLNQIGYSPKAVKRVFVSGSFEGNFFRILNEASKEVVFSGTLSKSKEWAHSGTSVCTADFSDFQQIGKYIIEVGNSYRKINIIKNVNKPLGIAALKSYYYARASKVITKEFAGEYARDLGHPDTEVKIHAHLQIL